jgi:hypothetical protein
MAWLALLLLLSQNLALGKTYPWALLPGESGRWLWVALSLGFVAVLLEQAGLVRLGERWARLGAWSVRFLGSRPGLILLVAGNAGFALANYYQFRKFGYAFPWLHLILLAVAVPFVRRDRFWLSCAISLGLLAASIVHFPDAVYRSDMFFAIRSAWDQVAAGHDPYAFGYNPSPHPWGLPYLPVIFFAHAPAWLLGVDLRWNEMLWRLAWMALLHVALARQAPASPWRTVAHAIVLNPYFNYRHELYFEVFFAGIAAYHAWPRWRWVTLPVLVWTRQWAWVMAPFLALDWLVVQGRHENSGQARRWEWGAIARQAGWLALGAAGVSGLVALALAPMTRPAVFREAIFLHADLAKFDYGLSLGPIAEKPGVLWLLMPLQGAAAAGLGLLALWRCRSGAMGMGASATEEIQRLGLVAVCAFLLLNRFYEVYMWQEPAFWMLAAYALPAPERTVRAGGMSR